MKTKLIILALSVSAFLAACTVTTSDSQTPVVSTNPTSTSTSTSTSTTTPPAPPATTAQPEPQTPPTANASVVGVWQSPSCGTRKYVRMIQFDAGGAFEGRDLVSPCPKGTQCIWSGIITTKGTYAVQGDKITFKDAQVAGRPGVGEPFPTAATIDRATSAPVETTSDGKSCVYTRAATLDPPTK